MVDRLPDRPLRIGVIGAGAATPELVELARAVGREVASAGAVLVCGGLGGVMEGAARGASEAGGLAVGLLPGEEAGQGSRWLSLPLATGLGEARNVLVVRVSEALVAVGGAWGTLSEMAVAGKLDRPVVVLRPPKAGALGFHTEQDPAEAARWALERARSGRSFPDAVRGTSRLAESTRKT